MGGGDDMSEDNEKINPVKVAAIGALLLLIVVGVVGLIRSNDTPATTTKSRLPVQMIDGQQLIDMQQQVKDMQAQIATLKATQPAPTPMKSYSCDKPDVECGPNEKTNPGVVVDFGMYNLTPDLQSQDNYLTFQFAERNGYTKRFYPVCPGQTIKAYTVVTILYHWRNWTGNTEGKRGCFVIDGFVQ